MDLDLGQVRAFVSVADQLHFSRAAGDLFLTQQALSKRIKRLEQTVGVSLFTRNVRSVQLTRAGDRFLPYARDLLATAEAAGRALRESLPAIRVDVWGQVHAPTHVLRAAGSDTTLSLSMRRSDAASTGALRRGELDLAFVGTLTAPLADLSYEEVYREPMAVLVHPDHPLGNLEVWTVDDLRHTGIWYPDLSAVPELQAFFHDYAKDNGIDFTVEGTNLGLRDGVALMRQDPARVTVLGAEWDIGDEKVLRRVPLTPTPAYSWSMAWRKNDRNPALAALVQRIRQVVRRKGWLDLADNPAFVDGPRRG
ncbi:LysR family transcriptional regulator [Fodinicola feengrottensis]|uniref:LysR family transcriptional regulator n=1 Tax=Fodinicola feengrottensis TaxID=435914 RepID=A0ABN2HC19_9ACTN